VGRTSSAVAVLLEKKGGGGGGGLTQEGGARRQSQIVGSAGKTQKKKPWRSKKGENATEAGKLRTSSDRNLGEEGGGWDGSRRTKHLGEHS